MKKNAPKFVIIDGNALIHRSFHALPPTLTTKDGRQVNAVYGFTSFILKAFIELKPEFAVLTFDRPAPTFRHLEYTEYKATRHKAPDGLFEQFPIARQVAEALDMPIFELDGYEADDLIGTIARQAATDTDWHSIVITGDMDTLQLVNERTSVYAMSRGLSESVLYTPEVVKAKYGIEPSQVIDYKAIRGDASDNIPGVRGIGEKGATELLQRYTTLDGVYEAVAKEDPAIKPRILELLKTGKDSAYMSRRLATIDCKAPIDISWPALRLDSFDEKKAIELFYDLEFRTLIGKLEQVKNLHQEVGEAKPSLIEHTDKFERNRQKRYQLVENKDIAGLISKLEKRKAFAFSLETEGEDPMHAEALMISFCFKEGEAFCLKLSSANDLFSFGKSNLSAFKGILENPGIKKYGHNLKFAIRALRGQGIELHGIVFDSLLASYLLQPDNRQHNLDVLAFRDLKYEKISLPEITGKGKEAKRLKDIPTDILRLYSGENADCIFQLESILTKDLKEAKLDALAKDLELPLSYVLADMEDLGIKLDGGALEDMEKEFSTKLQELIAEAYSLAGEEFNINSPKQLQGILFTKLGLEVKGLRKTKTGLSTADEELEKLKGSHPIIPVIQRYRELSKLQSTYIQALPSLIDPADGRIHTTYNQTIAATGRLSSMEPNLQNIPTRTEEGREIRKAFISEKGYKLISFDYSQIELRLAAHFSKDKRMAKAFKDGDDIHTITAAAIKGIKPEDVTKNMRRAAKATNFGIIYGQGPHGLSEAAGISYGEAKEFIDRYLKVYPGVKKMMDRFIALAREKGYAETIFNRRRPLPELESTIPQVRRTAERMAINTPLQGTAADMIKKAMLDIASYLKGKQDEIRLLLQVHDELIFEVKADKLDKHAPKIKELMESALPLSVPVLVEASSGDNWGELK
ncbi:MAG: DNA polymerase I [Bacillota bacterium]